MSVPESHIDNRTEYWKEYTNLQRVKHELIRCYLGGWFPILASWNGRVIYFDTHAGRGKHMSGQSGSPLIALETLLSHSSRERLLAKCEFLFAFVELDSGNCKTLEEEIQKLRPIPKGIEIHPIASNGFAQLQDILNLLRERRSRIAPAFVFVDPYGFKIPMRLLSDVMQAGAVELFMNVMWRELDMMIRNTHKSATPSPRLDEFFDSADWRSRIDAEASNERSEQAVSLLREVLRAKWATPIYMRVGGRTRYVLIHFSNNDKGRDLIKHCMWNVCPRCDEGKFFASKSDNPNQQSLLADEPDLQPLQKWILDKLQMSGGQLCWLDLADLLHQEIWREPHLNQALRILRDTGQVTSNGKFGRAANPVVKLG